MQLRDYQIRAVTDTRSAFSTGLRRVLLVSPTGSGKTVIYVYLAFLMAQRGKRIFILEHMVELIKQTSAKLNAFGVPHGIITPGFPRNPDALVQVASVQTLIHVLDGFPIPDLLIIDEAHHCISSTQWGLISIAMCTWILGVTATPIRSDGVGLGDVFQTIVHGPSVQELMMQGHLVSPRYYSSPDGGSIIAGDYIAHYRQLADHQPAIAFCRSVDHSILVSKQFQQAGYRAKYVSGGMRPQEREAAITDLSNGSVEILCSCDVVSEGTDLPNVVVGILLRRTQSLALHLQQLGRCLRTAPGKDNAIFLDHVGNLF